MKILNFSFHPVALTVHAGTALTVTNSDSTEHTATARAGAFDSGAIKPGQSARIVLDTPGSYSYICSFHPFMVGRITVLR